MQAIKALVIFMGVLLVVGIGFLGYGMYSKSDKLAKAPAAPEAQVTTSQASKPAVVPHIAPASALPVGPLSQQFGTISLHQPHGSSIVSVQGWGTLLLVTVRGGDESDRVFVIDPAQGRVNGQVSVNGTDAPATSQSGQ